MLCKTQHSRTKNKNPPFRLPLHFTTSSIPPNPHLNHKLPQQRKRKRKKENMTILKSFPLPSSPSALQIPNEKEKDSPPSNFFIAFLASKDPLTNQPWCPDVRAALPILEATFQETTTSQGAEGEEEKEEGKKSTTTPPVVAFIEVGQKTEYVFSFSFSSFFFCCFFLFFSPFSSSSFLGKQNRWKNPHNVFRTQWNIHNVPVLVRYELVGENTATTTKQVKEVGRLVEGEILDERRLQELVYG